MQTVNVDMHFRVRGAEDLDALTNQVFEALLGAEATDPAISNSGLQSELATGKVWIQVAAKSSDFSQAASTGAQAILSAINASKSDRITFELLEQSAALAA